MKTSESRSAKISDFNLHAFCEIFLALSLMWVSTSISVQATEAPSSLVYQGRILKPDSSPLEGNSVSFDVSIYSADGSCLLYEETHSVDMAGSGGSFALTLGTGVSTGPSYTIKEVISNGATFTGGGSCSYTPSSGDSRILRVTFNDGSGNVALQDQNIRSVPYAIYASQLEGKNKSDFIQVNTGTSALTQSNAETLFQSATYTELLALAGGTSTQFAKAADLPVSSGVLNLSGAGQGVRVLDTPAGGDYAVNKNYSDAFVGGRAVDSTNLSGLSNGESIKWDSTANSGIGGWVRFTPASASGFVVNGGQAGAVSLGPSDANSLSLLTAGIARLSIDSGGHIGIQGSPDSTTPLHIYGGGGYYSAKFGQYNSTDFYESSSGNEIRSAGNGFNGHLIFGADTGDGSTERLRITDSGKIGMGTTSPSSNLDISGTNANGTLRVYDRTATTGQTRAIVRAGAGQSTTNLSEWQDTSGSVLAAVTNDGTFVTPEIYFSGPSGSFDNPSANGYSFNWGSGGTKASFANTGSLRVITDSGGIPFDGTAVVGSGNTIVAGLALTRENSSGAGAGGGGISISFNSETSSEGTFREAAKIAGVFDDTSNSSKDGSLRFYTMGPNAGSGTTNTTERMRIDSSGRVGIGTISPANLLDVKDGDLRVFSSSAGAGDVTLYSGHPSGIYITGSGDPGPSLIDLRSRSQTSLRFDDGMGLNQWDVGVNDPEGTADLQIRSNDGAQVNMNFQASGNVGIGTTSPSEKLHIVGNLRVQGSTDCTLGNGSGGTNCSSDIRLKENIVPIVDPLGKILSLRGVEFDWNEKSQSPGRHDIGVIAQEVEKVFPTAVVEDSSSGYKKVDYAVLVAPIIQAVKQLRQQMLDIWHSLQNDLNNHSDQLSDLKGNLANVQSLLEKERVTREVESLQLRQENSLLKSRLEALEKNLKLGR